MRRLITDSQSPRRGRDCVETTPSVRSGRSSARDIGVGANEGTKLTSVKIPQLPYADGSAPVNALLEMFSQRRAGNPLVWDSRGPLRSSKQNRLSDGQQGSC